MSKPDTVNTVRSPHIFPVSHSSRAKRAFSFLVSLREFGVGLALLVVVSLFSYFEPSFFSWDTFGDIFTQSAELGVAATGVTLLMIAGEFDLSIGSVFALAGILLATFTTKLGWPSFAGLGVVLLVPAVVGSINGFVTLGAKIPSFIATLGAMMFWRGMALAFTEGWPVSMEQNMGLVSFLGGGNLWGTYKVSVLWWIITLVVFAWILRWSPFGNHVMAVGGNAKAAARLGVSPYRVKLYCFMIAAFLAAISGLMQLGRMGSMSPVWGDGLALEAIAAAVVGGAWLSGGIGSIWGTALGALTISSIRVGLVMVGAPTYWYTALVGVVVVLAVVMNLRLHPWLQKKLGSA